MNKNRSQRAIEVAIKIPRSANPLVNTAYNYVTPTLEIMQAGDRWWMEDGEIKKGKAEAVEYRYMIKEQKKHVLSVHLCMCSMCIKRLRDRRTTRKAKAEQLTFKLSQHNPASIIKVTV